jgi:hypothetical protein
VAEANSFPEVFRRLREIMAGHVPPLLVTTDGPQGYSVSVDRPDILPEARRYFGGVKIGKSYVSYYLIGVYADPRLITGMSAELRKRMQGKSCFNFTKLDEDLFAELAGLTERALKRYPEVLDAFLAGVR